MIKCITNYHTVLTNMPACVTINRNLHLYSTSTQTPSVLLSIPQHIITASGYNNLLYCVFISSEELFIQDIFNTCTHNQTHSLILEQSQFLLIHYTLHLYNVAYGNPKYFSSKMCGSGIFLGP